MTPTPGQTHAPGAAAVPPGRRRFWRARLSEGVTSALRRAILAAARSPRLGRVARRHGMRLGAARFVAGETLDEAVPVLRRLDDAGLVTNTTLLGEAVRDADEVARVVSAYEEVLRRIAAEGLRTNVALKLTHLGLVLDPGLAYANLDRLLGAAAAVGVFVRIDMEESAHVDATLDVYTRLRRAGHENLGVVLQSYLYRSADDLEALLPLRPNVRLVKGAYLEPPELAYPRKEDVDAAYRRLLERALPEAGYTAVATHDERLIEHALAWAERHGVERDRFELQMLYGVRPQLQLDLARRGYTVRVATPYGPDWYRYLLRRLAERPANLLFVVRSLAGR